MFSPTDSDEEPKIKSVDPFREFRVFRSLKFWTRKHWSICAGLVIPVVSSAMFSPTDSDEEPKETARRGAEAQGRTLADPDRLAWAVEERYPPSGASPGVLGT